MISFVIRSVGDWQRMALRKASFGLKAYRALLGTWNYVLMPGGKLDGGSIMTYEG
jgi:hypothetical protein